MKEKKKITLLVIAIFTLCVCMPTISFAATTNRMSNNVIGSQEDVLADGANGTIKAPVLRIYGKDLNDFTEFSTTTEQTFELDLTNAEWLDGFEGDSADGKFIVTDSDGDELNNGSAVQIITGMENITVTRLNNEKIIIKGNIIDQITSGEAENNEIGIAMYTRLTDNGDASVTIEPMRSVISSGTYKIATVVSEGTSVIIERKANISASGGVLKPIVIRETLPKTIMGGSIKLRLSEGWYFNGTPEIPVYPSSLSNYITPNQSFDNECLITVADDFGDPNISAIISITAPVKYDSNIVKSGDICEMTIFGVGVERTTLDVAKATEYDIVFEAEENPIPIFYPGENDKKKETLKMYVEETHSNVILTDNKGTITLPEEVYITGYRIENCSGLQEYITCEFEKNIITFDFGGEENRRKGEEIKFDILFTVSVAAGFKGDIQAILGGEAFPITADEQYKVIIGKVKSESSGGSSSGGGSSSSASIYTITKADITNGNVYCDLSKARKGNKVEFFVLPNEGYKIASVKVIDKNGKKLDLTLKDSGVYSFVMPSSNVTIDVDFLTMSNVALPYNAQNEIINDKKTVYSKQIFNDVYQSDWYYDPIMWAAENGIVLGYDDGSFRPNENITRAEMVIMLKNFYDFQSSSK